MVFFYLVFERERTYGVVLSYDFKNDIVKIIEAIVTSDSYEQSFNYNKAEKIN